MRQVGFGWTNGVVLWIARHYGDILTDPQCPLLLPTPASPPRGNAGLTVQAQLAAILGITSSVLGLLVF
jgi:alpha,alpha-trehalase